MSSPEVEEPVEYKSLQWFGATVRAHGSSILVRAHSPNSAVIGDGWLLTIVEHRPEGERRAPSD